MFKNYSEEYSKPLDCRECYETSYRFVVVLESLVLAKCLCAHGQNNTSTLPKYDPRLMQAVPFLVEKFKPKDDETAKGKQDSGGEVIHWWKEVKRISSEFWAANNPVLQ